MTATSATQQRSEQTTTRPLFDRFVWMFRKRN